MKSIAIAQAFGGAPPRSVAVLCLRAPNGGVDMIRTEWFTWLNIKRQPMISFTLRRDAAYGPELKAGDAFALAFPPREEAERYLKGVRVAPKGQDAALPEGVSPLSLPNVPLPVPGGSEVVLLCTLAGAYNYPFKKVRIFNCNLDKALGNRDN